jgi:hypothetical protein
MKTSEVLNAAADLIEARGWRQGEPGWRSGGSAGLCLEGALIAALSLDHLEVYGCPAYAAVADYLDRTPAPSIAPVKDALWQWNDAPGRTASEVIEVLRAAAVIEAAREEQDAAWATYADAVTA